MPSTQTNKITIFMLKDQAPTMSTTHYINWKTHQYQLNYCNYCSTKNLSFHLTTTIDAQVAYFLLYKKTIILPTTYIYDVATLNTTKGAYKLAL